jgi:DNA polymerase
MRVVRLQNEHDFDEWRAVARALLLGVVPPDEIRWEVATESGDIFAPAESIVAVTHRAVGLVPRRFVDLAKVALFHSDPRRFALLYRVLFRLQKHRELLTLRADPDVSRLYKLVSDLRETAEKERNLLRPISLQ